MYFGFSNKKRPCWLENPVDLHEEVPCIGHLMNHPECEGKIHLLCDIEIVLLQEQEAG